MDRRRFLLTTLGGLHCYAARHGPRSIRTDPPPQPMTGNWSVVLCDREASRWLDLSVWAFWLKHPEALVALPLNEPQQFRRLGEELDVLENDLHRKDFAEELKAKRRSLRRYLGIASICWSKITLGSRPNFHGGGSFRRPITRLGDRHGA